MTLEIMVPENTPFGKVTKSYKNLSGVKNENAPCDEAYHAPQVPINDLQ